MLEPYLAVTDQAWFDYLSERAAERGGTLDEVNFWHPRAQRSMARLQPGTPVFFRLKKPVYSLAGYGFFAHFALLSLSDAWEFFGPGNGDPDMLRFLERIGRYRGLDLIRDRAAQQQPIGCTILRDARFWPRDRWIRWENDQGWKRNIVQGKFERDAGRASRLLHEIQFDATEAPEELRDERFVPLEADEREFLLARTSPRIGQGTFRSRLLDAYGHRCAITREHTEIVLDAAHIQPYLGPRSNHLQNGLLLTKEFHTLFDRGYVTVTPDFEVRVSPRLQREWNNGHRYYPFDGRRIALPDSATAHPSEEVLAWHAERVFLRN